MGRGGKTLAPRGGEVPCCSLSHVGRGASLGRRIPKGPQVTAPLYLYRVDVRVTPRADDPYGGPYLVSRIVRARDPDDAAADAVRILRLLQEAHAGKPGACAEVGPVQYVRRLSK